MVETLARNWGWVLLRGLLAIVFGALTIFYPGIALTTLVLLFGAYALVDGLFLVIAGVANRRDQPRWGTLVVGGLLGIAAGIVTFVWPGITAAVLLAIIAVWAILIGIAEVVAAVRLRRVITNEWLLVLAGLASLAFGVFLFARPAAGALAVVLYIGVFAFVTGVLLTLLAFRLRSWGQEPHAV